MGQANAGSAYSDKVKRINKDGEEKEVQLKNLFYIAEAKRYDVKYMTNKFNNPYYQPKKKDPIVYTRHEMKIDYEKLGAQQQKELEALQEIQKRFIKHGGNESKRSSKFKTMKTALKRLTEQYEAMERILASEARDKDKQLAEGYKKLNAQREKLNTAIDRYLHKKHFNDISPENQKRIDIAGRLAGITKNAPESENLFASGKALKDRKEASMGAKNVHQLNTYVTNQIYSLMRDTLRTNVDALKQKDPKHALGVNALKAQERLWKYGQMDGADRTMSEDEKKVREQVPFGNLEAEKKLEAAGRPNMDQISRDLNAISLYAPELGEQVNKLMQHKENITPREVKAVLHELLVHESKTAANQKKIARPHVIRTGELGK